ncbi:MAG: hypothetical protein MSS69_07570 [Spirochaetales bacterium]|nr:hypothetical protein [Spirochaetales bacterium]
MRFLILKGYNNRVTKKGRHRSSIISSNGEEGKFRRYSITCWEEKMVYIGAFVALASAALIELMINAT